MRLWSIHPKHLDAAGLVALWREGLLARAVLAGKTKGYRNHPQLERFRAVAICSADPGEASRGRSRQLQPLSAIDCYLSRVYDEAVSRGFAFDRTKIRYRKCADSIAVQSGQLEYEWSHLKRKLRIRNPTGLTSLLKVRCQPHPCFRVIAGSIAEWERVTQDFSVFKHEAPRRRPPKRRYRHIHEG